MCSVCKDGFILKGVSCFVLLTETQFEVTQLLTESYRQRADLSFEVSLTRLQKKISDFVPLKAYVPELNILQVTPAEAIGSLVFEIENTSSAADQKLIAFVNLKEDFSEDNISLNFSPDKTKFDVGFSLVDQVKVLKMEVTKKLDPTKLERV